MGINISAMTIYNRKGEAVNDNTAIVGTGWSIEIGGEVTYLSVLGDLTGDGRITAADISYLRAIAASFHSLYVAYCPYPRLNMCKYYLYLLFRFP